jgi:ketosteroid isomerase-like protein
VWELGGTCPHKALTSSDGGRRFPALPFQILVSIRTLKHISLEANLMKRIVLVAFLTVVAGTLAVSLAKNSSSAAPGQAAGSVQDEIKKLELERNQAILHSDNAALDRMTSADYTVVDQWGVMHSKAEVLAGFKSGATKLESRELSDLNVRVHGNAAVVTGRYAVKGTENGKTNNSEGRFTRVYVKEKGNWISIANQATTIAK